MEMNCYLPGDISIKQAWYNLIQMLWYNSEIPIRVAGWTFIFIFQFCAVYV